MGVCTCYTRANGDLVRCRWHGGTKQDRIQAAKDAIRESEKELKGWRHRLAKVETS